MHSVCAASCTANTRHACATPHAPVLWADEQTSRVSRRRVGTGRAHPPDVRRAGGRTCCSTSSSDSRREEDPLRKACVHRQGVGRGLEEQANARARWEHCGRRRRRRPGGWRCWGGCAPLWADLMRKVSRTKSHAAARERDMGTLRRLPYRAALSYGGFAAAPRWPTRAPTRPSDENVPDLPSSRQAAQQRAKAIRN